MKLTLPTIQPAYLAAALGIECVVQAAVAVSILFALSFADCIVNNMIALLLVLHA